jgi:hypothetical protein
MAIIAISYRRSESSDIVGRIHDRLCSYYGPESVFIDINDIPLGVDFRTHIQSVLRKTKVLLVIIGQAWCGPKRDASFKIGDETDPVRVEVETAFQFKIPTIPVLVNGAVMPECSLLPPSLKELSYLNAAEVGSGQVFNSQMDRLIKGVDEALGSSSQLHDGSRGISGSRSEVTNGRKFVKLLHYMKYLSACGAAIVVAHHLVIELLDLNQIFMLIASIAISLTIGVIFSLMTKPGTWGVVALAVSTGIVSVAGMIISDGLNSGQPIMPLTKFEWRETLEYCVLIAFSFYLGSWLVRIVDRSLSVFRSGSDVSNGARYRRGDN